MIKHNTYLRLAPAGGMACLLILSACGSTDSSTTTSDDLGGTTAESSSSVCEAGAKEGKLRTYISTPLDTSQAVAKDFTAATGIDVEFTRVVGPDQYQRFLQEENAGKH